jgi:hypothetical protein
MLNHPNPCQNMLLPYMHQNIAQEAHLWVASSILRGKIDINTHLPPVTQTIRWSSLSIPYSFIEWNDSPNSDIQHPTTNSLQNGNVDGSSPTSPSDSSSREDSIVPGTPSSRTQPKNHPINPQKIQPVKTTSLKPKTIEIHSPLHSLPLVCDLVQGTTIYLPHLKKTDITTLNRPTKSTNIAILPNVLPRMQEESVNFTPPTPKPIKIKQVQSTLNPVSLNTKSNDKVVTTWGHSLDPIENLTTFRILYQNPNGINISNKAFQYKYSLSTCRSLNIAAITIVET